MIPIVHFIQLVMSPFVMMVDQDGDIDIDCSDTDCAFLCLEKNCADSTDDDHDGDIDCADSDCAGSTQCGETDCFDNIDNDGDGNTDCTDSECYADSACQIYSFDGTYAMDVTISEILILTVLEREHYANDRWIQPRRLNGDWNLYKYCSWHDQSFD